MGATKKWIHNLHNCGYTSQIQLIVQLISTIIMYNAVFTMYDYKKQNKLFRTK